MSEGVFNGFGLPDDVRQMREAIARFIREEILPAEKILSPEARGLPADKVTELRAKARQAGYWCFDAPEEHGGGGLSTFAFVNVVEEASKHKFCFPQPGGGAFGHAPPVVLYAGTPEQIKKYVRLSIGEGAYSYTAITEDTGGSDPSRAIRTKAELDGDSWVINGTKLWITNAEHALYGIVYARTPRGISAFIVDADTPGVSVSRILPVMRDHWPCEITYVNCRVPAGNMLGEEGQGLALASRWLTRGRLLYAARAVGVAEEALRMGLEWARERHTFGAALATRQATQFAVADSRIEIDAARMLTWQAAWTNDHGGNAKRQAAAAKVYAVEAASRVVDRVMQMMGAMGMSKELPLEAWYRDLRLARVLEGSSEILRQLVAREELGPAASEKRAS